VEIVALLGFAIVRTRTRLAPLLFALTLLAAPIAAQAHHRSGPCDIHRRDGETVVSHSRRLIRCAAGRWEVPGGAAKAVCIADAESGLDPEAGGEDGEYLGLFQHSAEAWPGRYETWTRDAWELDENALSGRTNAIVTLRMVHADGWGPWEGVGDC
jgi:hypothetical protein